MGQQKAPLPVAKAEMSPESWLPQLRWLHHTPGLLLSLYSKPVKMIKGSLEGRESL